MYIEADMMVLLCQDNMYTLLQNINMSVPEDPVFEWIKPFPLGTQKGQRNLAVR